ncbi:hypothetical protein JXA47_08115 [Candidatus Sumerlaeota bacterium]|nr:hypothetical protein [Candidatus Sumerlaeota bacterium]
MRLRLLLAPLDVLVYLLMLALLLVALAVTAVILLIAALILPPLDWLAQRRGRPPEG